MRFSNHFLVPLIGKKIIKFHQHEKTSYLRPDGNKGSKWELVEKTSSIAEAVEFLAVKMFGHQKQETYLQHVFKKILGSRGRSNLRQNIGDKDMIVYSDFSKGGVLCFFYAHFLCTNYFRIAVMSTRSHQV